MKSICRWYILTLMLIVACATPVVADELSPGDSSNGSTADTRVHDVDADSHPMLPWNTIWAGSAIIAILGLFIAAMVVGPIIRSQFPQEVPDAFSHAEDPSHHAGSEHSLWEEKH